MSQRSKVAVSPAHFLCLWKKSESAPLGAWRRNVVAVQFKDRGFATQVRSTIAGDNLLLLARQERKVVVRPENRRQILSAFSLGDAQMHHEGKAAGGIADAHADPRFAALLFLRGPNVQRYSRQRVQAGQIGELRLRRVYRVLCLLPVQATRPRRHPLKTAPSVLCPRGLPCHA